MCSDTSQESVIASTNPNRVTWASGSINVPGSPQNKSEGGYPYIDNNETPGCETGGFNCYPLSWKTTAEFYQDAGVSWSIFQDADNFDDNPLAWFAQFQDALPGSQLSNRGFVGSSLNDFYAVRYFTSCFDHHFVALIMSYLRKLTSWLGRWQQMGHFLQSPISSLPLNSLSILLTHLATVLGSKSKLLTL